MAKVCSIGRNRSQRCPEPVDREQHGSLVPAVTTADLDAALARRRDVRPLPFA
jgi:hypothetical protein